MFVCLLGGDVLILNLLYAFLASGIIDLSGFAVALLCSSFASLSFSFVIVCLCFQMPVWVV